MNLFTDTQYRAAKAQVNALLNESRFFFDVSVEKAVALGEAAIPILVQLIRDQNAHTRRFAAETVKRIDSDRVIPSVKEQMDRMRGKSLFRDNVRGMKELVEVHRAAYHGRDYWIMERLIESDNLKHAQIVIDTLTKEDVYWATAPLINALFQRRKQLERRKSMIWIQLFVQGFLFTVAIMSIGYIKGKPVTAFDLVLRPIMTLLVLVPFLLYTRFSGKEFYQSAIEKLYLMEDPKAIGGLAIHARDKRFKQTAIEALHFLLPKVQTDEALTLDAAQMKALSGLLYEKDEALKEKIIHALSYVISEAALEPLEKFIQDKSASENLKAEAERAAAILRPKLIAKNEDKTLLRAAGRDTDSDHLLRVADAKADIPDEQLLRRNDQES